MILNANFYTPSSELFKRLNLLPFQKRVMYFRCIFIFKCINDLSSDFFKDTFLDVSLSHSFNTRYSTRGNLLLPKCNTEYLKKSFIYSAINQWNLLPNHLKAMEIIFSFKSNLKTISFIFKPFLLSIILSTEFLFPWCYKCLVLYFNTFAIFIVVLLLTCIYEFLCSVYFYICNILFMHYVL